MFLSDGRVEAGNNTVERAMRPIPLGRNNALLAGSDNGAERWAILASLIVTIAKWRPPLSDPVNKAFILVSTTGRMAHSTVFVSSSRRHLPERESIPPSG